MVIEKYIKICKEYADSQQYCWFRISYANIGVHKNWVVWFEGLNHNKPIDYTKGNPNLEEALKQIVDLIQLSHPEPEH